jgi:hypothetical protein
MRYFIIFNESIGKWLPHPPSGRGATWVQPTFLEPPRLWVQPAGATRALAWWLQGTHTRGQESSSFATSYLEYESEEEVICTPRPERIAADWAVVPVNLTIIQKRTDK